jgi:S1-C subfamily serine protease
MTDADNGVMDERGPVDPVEPARPAEAAPPAQPTQPIDQPGLPWMPPQPGTQGPQLPPWPPYPVAPTPERRPRARRRLVAAVVAGFVLLAGGIGIGRDLTRGGSGAITISPGQTANGSNVSAVAKKVDPAVVDVNTVITDGLGNVGQGAGTGMIVSSAGEILTNNHVIEGATKIQVTIPGHSGSFSATVLGVSPTSDVALIKVSGLSGLPTVTFADSSSLSVGQEVVAIGNALGQGGTPTVTGGQISSLGRSITVSDGRGGSEHLTGMIQTDAPIQPGDSGGPLVNSSGQVVGMITAAARSTFGQQPSNVGFAIPSSTAVSVVNKIQAGESSQTIFIGPSGYMLIGVQDLNPATAARLGLRVSSGVLVIQAQPGGPAAAAGISANSVITAIDGQRVTSAETLGTLIHQHAPGESIQVTWVDQSGTHTASVRLVSGPAV